MMNKFFRYSTAGLLTLLTVSGFAGCNKAPESSAPASEPEQVTASVPPESITSATAEQPGAEVQLPSAPTEEAAGWAPYVLQRQVIVDSGSLCGTAYIGYIDPEADSAACRELFLNSEYAQTFETLTDIPDEFCVSSEGGTDLYLIIPADTDCIVTVYEWNISEDNGFMGEKGEVLLSSDCGAPFLLKCNRSDIMPDTLVEITDGSGQTLSWNPSISLKDGTVSTEAGTMKVYDLTNYPELMES